MRTIKNRMETVHFSRMIKLDGNTSEDLCEMRVNVSTVVCPGFRQEGFVSPEYAAEITRDVVRVDGRYFQVEQATSNMKDYWLSVKLPPGLDPRPPKPREWVLCLSDKGYLFDPKGTGNPTCCPTVKVREVID